MPQTERAIVQLFLASEFVRRASSKFGIMLSIVLGVCQGVAGAGLVAGCGILLKRFEIVDQKGVAVLSKLIYHLFNPAFAFHSIASVPRALLLRGLWIVLGAAVSLSLSLVLGAVLLSCWPSSSSSSSPSSSSSSSSSSASAPATKVLLLLAAVCSNVGSLPLYLSVSLPLAKPDVFSFLTIYIAAQSLFMWGIFYPLGVMFISKKTTREESADETELSTDLASKEVQQIQPPPGLSLKDLLFLVFNPVVCAVIIGVVVSAIVPVQHFLFETAPLLAQVSDSLGACNVGSHLLLLGLQLFPFQRPVEWSLVLMCTAIRLVLVPSIVFLFSVKKSSQICFVFFVLFCFVLCFFFFFFYLFVIRLFFLIAPMMTLLAALLCGLLSHFLGHPPIWAFS